MEASALFTKRPADRLDYDVDFRARRWIDTDDTILSATVVVETEGTVFSDDHAPSGGVVKVWLGGGTVGEEATITVKITTSQGREKEICFRLRIRENC
jgi:hypothetical protein